MHNHLHLINFSKSYFILQDEKNYDLDGYNRFNINHKTIYFTRDFRYYSLSFQDYHIFILGELVDVRDSKKPVNAIVSDLLQYPIDSDSFLNEMSFSMVVTDYLSLMKRTCIFIMMQLLFFRCITTMKSRFMPLIRNCYIN